MITHSPMRVLKALLASAVVLLSASAQAQQVFRVTAIPDESPTELARKAGPLIEYLEGKLGMKVDVAWFGGFTFAPEGKEVLDLHMATRFSPSKPENYNGIEAAGKSAGLL